MTDLGTDFLAEADIKDGKIVSLEEAMNQVPKPQDEELWEFADQTGFKIKNEKPQDKNKYLEELYTRLKWDQDKLEKVKKH